MLLQNHGVTRGYDELVTTYQPKVYHVCAAILRAAFGTTPEPATVALFEQVRCDPGSV
jgi:hypothetical protein